MGLLKNALKFGILTFVLLAIIFSCKEKQANSNIIYKIPNPLREGVRKNGISAAKIKVINIDLTGQLKPENNFGYLEYDSFGNISYENIGAWLNEYRFLYDENGFKKIMWNNSCNTSKEAYFYKHTAENELTMRLIFLKDAEWKHSIDTSNHSTIIPKAVVYQFNDFGNLVKEKLENKINTTYAYDSLNRLTTIIDSSNRDGDDYDLPVRKEFIYNKDGKLAKVSELNRSTLLSTANVNQKGLIDTILYFNKSYKPEKIEVYLYK